MNFLDLYGPGLALNNVDAKLATGRHSTARAWSMAIWLHPSSVDGIFYFSRHDVTCYCIAVYDRFKQKGIPCPLRETNMAPILDKSTGVMNPDFVKFLDKYKVALI